MNTETTQVESDYRQYRDEIDGAELAHTSMKNGIGVSLLLLIPILTVLYYTVSSTAEFFILQLLVSSLIMGPVIFYFAGQERTKMNMGFKGYDVRMMSPENRTVFGSDEYEILRADPGNFQGSTIGINQNPFTVSKHTLDRIENKQRDRAKCELCQSALFGHSTIESEGGYFVEKRKRYWIFGLPIREKILGWESYCSEHKPHSM